MSEKYVSVVKQVLSEISIALSSIYLTFVIDVYTLNTWPKRIFVFCYFLVICHVALFLKRKLQKGKKLPKNMLAAAGLLAVAIVLLGHNTFFPKAQETTVSLAAVPCEDGSYHEVWLTAVKIDGQEIQLSQLELDANQGWTYSGDYDDYVFYPVEEADNTNYLTFGAVGKKIALTFARNAWSGVVDILINEENSEALSLAGSEDNDETACSTIDAVKKYAVWEAILYGGGAWIVVSFSLCLLLFALDKENKNFPRVSISGNSLLNFIWK